jgi:uncharacterized protein (TIGR02246 family)
VNRIVDREQKLGKPSATASAADSEHLRPDAAHGAAAPNPALSEIYERLYPEIRRQRPNQEAITAALQAMQRLATEMDSEQAAEDAAAELSPSSTSCPSCGHQNRPGTRYCAKCGHSAEGGRALSATQSPLSAAESLPQTPDLGAMHEVHPPAGSAGAIHHYHHHYHHHYLPGGSETAFVAPRANAPESAREADRLRLAAAAKGEPMSRGEAAVRRLTQEWVLACNTRQLDELLDLYAPDALVLRSNLPAIRGAAAVREFFFGALEAGLGEVSVEPMRVEVAGDLAHEVGRYSALVPGTAGKRREERGKYLWVFSKQSSGDWKLISECWSADLTLTGAESDVPKSPGTVASKGIPRKGL